MPSKYVPKGGPKGFAKATPEARRAAAQKGGRRAHELGVAHQFSHDEAVKAGRKGGLVTSARKRQKADEPIPYRLTEPPPDAPSEVSERDDSHEGV